MLVSANKLPYIRFVAEHYFLHTGLVHTITGSGVNPKLDPPISDSTLPHALHFGLKKLSIAFIMFDNIFIIFMF